MRLYDRLIWVIQGALKLVLRPHLRRARCLVFHGDSVLLVQHIGGGREWTIPGGGVQAGESVVDTAKRELQEELNLNITEAREDGEITVREGFMTLTALMVIAKSADTALKPRRLEIRQADWFKLDNLPEHVSSLAREALDKAV